MTHFTGKILALDLAAETGWAHGRPGQVPTFGNIRFAPRGSAHALIYRKLRAWLDAWITHATSEPDLIVYESAAIAMQMIGRTNAQTVRLLTGMCEHVEELCYDRVELREASTSQVRAHFLGSNRIKRDEAKAMTMNRCIELGWMVENHDQADACATWDYQVCCLRPDLAHKTTELYGRRIISDF